MNQWFELYGQRHRSSPPQMTSSGEGICKWHMPQQVCHQKIPNLEWYTLSGGPGSPVGNQRDLREQVKRMDNTHNIYVSDGCNFDKFIQVATYLLLVIERLVRFFLRFRLLGICCCKCRFLSQAIDLSTHFQKHKKALFKFMKYNNVLLQV